MKGSYLSAKDFQLFLLILCQDTEEANKYLVHSKAVSTILRALSQCGSFFFFFCNRVKVKLGLDSVVVVKTAGLVSQLKGWTRIRETWVQIPTDVNFSG